jgi:hypothetical protein
MVKIKCFANEHHTAQDIKILCEKFGAVEILECCPVC